MDSKSSGKFRLPKLKSSKVFRRRSFKSKSTNSESVAARQVKFKSSKTESSKSKAPDTNPQKPPPPSKDQTSELEEIKIETLRECPHCNKKYKLKERYEKHLVTHGPIIPLN